jgi:hypothetical protein
MRDNKAAGTDGIPAEFITHACPVDNKRHNCLIPYLTHLSMLYYIPNTLDPGGLVP